MPDYVEIKGLEEVAKRLDNLADLRKLVPSLEAGARHIEGVVKEYPPATEANAPKGFRSGQQNRWYQRGYGPRWVRKDGSWGGRKTSETLGRKWTVSKRDHGLTHIVGNNVSYSPYVHSQREQARFHKRRKWKTIEDVVKQETDMVVNFVKFQVDKILDGRI